VAAVASITEPSWDAEFEPFKVRLAQVGRQAGGRELGASLYEIDPGGKVSPLHVHYANEEMILVLSGRPTLRTPDGERELETGEVVAFPVGMEGAHQVRNRSDEVVRVLIVSTMILPEVVKRLDSNTVLAMTGTEDGRPQGWVFPEDAQVDPMEGEVD
jgi:uncharacterized cupin superfamily protein